MPVAGEMLLTVQEDGIMVINIADVPGVEEMLAIAYHCFIFKGQMGESIAEGGSSESNNTVQNRKMVTKEVQDTHAKLSAPNCGKEPELSRKSSCDEERIYWEEIPNRTFRNIETKIDMRMLCGLVVRVSGYRYRGPGFDSRRYQIF